jgi:AcrR family transcriptional regulator
MPRTGQVNQLIRETQCTKILDGARKVFALKGETATMSDIALAAGVSQGLAYRYFNSKEEIFKTLLKQAVETSFATMQNVMEMPGTPKERLDFLITKMLESRRERIEYSQLISKAFESDTTPDEQKELIRKQVQNYQKVLRQLIVDCQSTGEVADDDPDQLMMAITASLEGLARLALRQPLQFEKHFPNNEIILRMLKPYRKE